MPLLSIQRYLQGILDGLPVPGQTKALKAQITPPPLQPLKGPMAFVWGASLRVDRQAGPRITGKDPSTAGFKHLAWELDVWLSYMTNPNSQTLDSEFPAFIDAVMVALWQTPMTGFIDPQGTPCPRQTDGATQIMSIGENMRLEVATPRAVANARTLYFSAQLTLDVYEVVQS